MTTIYIDVLIILNIYVTFFLIKATGLFLHKKFANHRVAFGSLIGGASALLILLPQLNTLVTMFIKCLLGVIIVTVAIGYNSKRTFIKQTIVFIMINMVFAGLMILLWLFSAPIGMFYNNGTAYFDISFAAITISTVIAYGLIKLIRYIMDVKLGSEMNYTIKIKHNDKEVTFTAFGDTGNTLTDFFTGLPVIICDSMALHEIMPHEIDFDKIDSLWNKNNNTTMKGIRFLPYSTISSSALLPVFKPQNIVITDNNGYKKDVQALIGISKERLKNDGVSALFNPKLLI